MSKSKMILVKYNDDSRPIDFEKGIKQKEAELKLVGDHPAEEGRKESPTEPPYFSSKIFSELKSAVESEGHGASQFAEMLTSLSNVVTDEAMLYAAAFKAVQKSYKMTLEQILHAQDAKLKALQVEGKTFLESIEQNKKELTKFEAKIREKDDVIKTLKERIETIEVEKNAIERSIQKKRAKYETEKKEFAHAFELLKDEIQKETEILHKYLK